MSCAQQQVKEITTSSASKLLDEMKLLGEVQANPCAKKVLNSELWHACAGPLVSLPQPGSLVYYFPQGHSEQVSASTRRATNSQIPSYPNLPSQLMCQVHNVTLHADKDSDEIYAQMTLQPVNSEADVFQIPDFGHTKSKQPTEFFCKNLTASDTSTHGGFSVPRRAAEKLFPQLDYTMQPPNQELIVRDLHENVWTFRHIYRGQPKRHLLTTGWSLFVGAKRLKAGDSVLFVRDEKSQLLLGVRRCSRQQTTLPSSVLSADTMHIGVLAAAAHAAASCGPFTVYYNPRACPSEFIIPLAKYHKAAYTPVSIGMRFGMMFETEESSKRRYMGTVVGINDFDSLRWPNSKWHNLQVEWDEPGYGERPDRVNIWEIETPESLFIFPPSLKRQCIPGFVVPGSDMGFENVKSSLQALENRNGDIHPSLSNFCSEQLMKMLTKPQSSLPGSEFGCHQSVYAVILQKIKSNGFSAPSSSTLEAVMATQSAMQHDETLMKRDMRERNGSLNRKHQTQPLESTPLEDLNFYHSIEEHDLLMASKLVVQYPAEIPQRNYQELNEHDDICENSLTNEKIDNKSESTYDAAKNEWKEPSRNKLKTPPDLITPHCLIKLAGECEKSPIPSGEENIGYESYRSPMFAENEEIQTNRQSLQIYQKQLEPSTEQSPSIETENQLNENILNNQPYQGCQSSHYTDNDDEWILQPSLYQSFADSIKTPDFFSNSSMPGHLSVSVVENAESTSADISSILMNSETVNPFETCQFSSFPDTVTPTFMPVLMEETKASQTQNLKVGTSEACSNLNNESTNANIFPTSCVSSSVFEGFSAVKGSSFSAPSEDLFGCLALNQDIQSQVTSTSIADSQVLSLQDIPDTSGGTSSGSIDANDHNLLSKGAKKQIVQHPMRTYTKVQKFGSVGRSIDVTRFRNYQQLKSAIARMFGLEGQLDDPGCKEWKLVYVDYENDVLLVGDDPWEEFVNCVRCIRILSPTEVQQMSQEGLQFMNSYQPRDD